MTVYIVTTADNVEHRVEAVNETAARNKVRVTDPTLGIIRVQEVHGNDPAADRAEQAIALIEEFHDRVVGDVHAYAAKEHLTHEGAIRAAVRMGAEAALTASEAEVTRLETGIAEALKLDLPQCQRCYYGDSHARTNGDHDKGSSEAFLADLLPLPTKAGSDIDALIAENQSRSRWTCAQCGKESGMYGHMGRCTPLSQPTTDTNGAHA